MMRMHVSVNGLLWFALLTAAALLSSSSSMTNCQAFSFLPATRVVAPAQGRRGGRSSSQTIDKKQSPIKVEKVTPQKKKPKFGGGVLPPKGTRAVVGKQKSKQESPTKPKKTFGGSFTFAAPTLGKPKSPSKVEKGTPEKTKPKFGAGGRQPKGTRAIVANTKKQAPTKNKGRPVALTVKTKSITKAVVGKKKKESPIKKNTKLTLPVLGLTKKNKKQLVASPKKKKKKKKLGTAGMVRATQRTKLQGTQTNKAASLTTRPVSRRDLTVGAALAAAVAVFTITPKSSTKEKTTLATTKKKPPAASKTTLANKKGPATTTIATGTPATGKIPDITKKYATRSYAPVEELPIRFKARSDLDEVSFVTFQAKLQTQEVEEVNIYRTDGNVGYATVRKVALDTNGDASDGVLDGYKREQFRIEKVDPLGPGLPYKLMIATKQAGVPYNLL